MRLAQEPRADSSREVSSETSWQREVLSELRQIRQLLEQQRRPAPPRDDARFLAVIVGSVAGRVFSAAELLKHARVDAELRQVLGRLTSRQVGKRLRALAGRNLSGFVLQKVGRDNAGMIWAVQVVDLHTRAGRDDDRSA